MTATYVPMPSITSCIRRCIDFCEARGLSTELASLIWQSGEAEKDVRTALDELLNAGEITVCDESYSIIQ